MYGTSHQQIVVLHRHPKSTLHYCISDRVRHGTSSIPDLLPEAHEASTEPLMEFNHQYRTCWQALKHCRANTEATKLLNGAQLSITNLPANTDTMSNTQHRNFISVTNISNKLGHSTTTLRNI